MNLSSVNSTYNEQATSHSVSFCHDSAIVNSEKKSKIIIIKKRQKNKKTKSSSIMDFVIMENEIRAASKHVPDVQKMAIALSTREQLFKRWIALSVG